jgi:hypothetical protein
MSTPLPPELLAYGKAKVDKAKVEFEKLLLEFGGENVIRQITAANKTRLIGDAVRDVVYWGQTGSLWEAYRATEAIKITPEMAPFLTEDKKQEFKNRIVQIISSL